MAKPYDVSVPKPILVCMKNSEKAIPNFPLFPASDSFSQLYFRLYAVT